jgi:hypothetical protein
VSLPKATIHGKPIREWEEDTLDAFLKMFAKRQREAPRIILRHSLAEQEAVWDRYLLEGLDEALAEKLKKANRLN